MGAERGTQGARLRRHADHHGRIAREGQGSKGPVRQAIRLHRHVAEPRGYVAAHWRAGLRHSSVSGDHMIRFRFAIAALASIVVVVHEIFGLSSWVRAVADQLAADGFVAIAPDLLTGKIAPNLDDSTLKAQGPALIATLDPEDVQRKLDAVAQYAMARPAAEKKYGIVGFC